MTQEEIIKHLHEALNSVDITFPYRYVLVEAIEALSQLSLPDGMEEAAIQAAQSDMQDRQIMEASDDERMRYSRIFRRGFKVGVKWQKAQDQKTIELAEDHAMLAGMNKMEQQMMEKAYDTIMQFDELDDLVPTFEDMQKFGFKEGDKVKIIILKNNETSF